MLCKQADNRLEDDDAKKEGGSGREWTGSTGWRMEVDKKEGSH